MAVDCIGLLVRRSRAGVPPRSSEMRVLQRRDPLMTKEPAPIEFAVYMAPGTSPLSAQEIAAIKLQTADLLGCEPGEIAPVLVELNKFEEIEQEFACIPDAEQSREPYLALIALLRSGARTVGNRCCMLVYDLRAPFPALDYLKGLAEITHLPVFLGVCRPPPAGSAHRQILVRRLR
jgi:hypothetical protein